MGAAGPWHETGHGGGGGLWQKKQGEVQRPPLEDPPPHQLPPSSWPWDPAGCDAGLVGCGILISWGGGPHPHLNISVLFPADESCPPSGRCSGARSSYSRTRSSNTIWRAWYLQCEWAPGLWVAPQPHPTLSHLPPTPGHVLGYCRVRLSTTRLLAWEYNRFILLIK